MIKIAAKKEELQAAAKTARSVELFSIELKDVSATSRLTAVLGVEAVTLSNEMAHKNGQYEIVDSRFLVTEVGAKVRFFQPDKQVDGTDNTLAQIEVTYNAIYKLPGTPIPDDIAKNGLPAFARYNALVNCWPYLRLQINVLANQLRLPYQLPLLVVDAEKTPKAEPQKADNS